MTSRHHSNVFSGSLIFTPENSRCVCLFVTYLFEQVEALAAIQLLWKLQALVFYVVAK